MAQQSDPNTLGQEAGPGQPQNALTNLASMASSLPVASSAASTASAPITFTMVMPSRPAPWAVPPSAEKKKTPSPTAKQKQLSPSGTNLTAGATFASPFAASAYQGDTPAATSPTAEEGDAEPWHLDFLDAQLGELERENWKEKQGKERWGKRWEAVKKAEEDEAKKKERRREKKMRQRMRRKQRKEEERRGEGSLLPGGGCAPMRS